MSRFAWARALAASLLIAGTGSAAVADDLANRAFQLQFDASGIRSLRRTADVHDTDYIAANGALGRLLIRFRSTPNGHWRELRELLLRAPSSTTGGPQAIEYALGTLLPTLASKASPSAVRGVGTLRGLNDGLVPVPPGAGGRGGRGAGPGAQLQPAAQVPVFTWTRDAPEPGSGGTAPGGQIRWVQYTFPTPEEISRTEVFWAGPPATWRLLYQDGMQWKEVDARGAYGVEPNAFATVEFAPVKTNALRIEVTLPPQGTPGVAEWRVGQPPSLVESSDLSVREEPDSQSPGHRFCHGQDRDFRGAGDQFSSYLRNHRDSWKYRIPASVLRCDPSGHQRRPGQFGPPGGESLRRDLLPHRRR